MFTFASLGHPDHRYVIERDFHNLNRSGVTWAGYFPTYGDGDVQHGPTCGIGQELLPDFLGSLAARLAEVEDDKLVEKVASYWPREYNPATIRFMRTVKYVEGKPAYFSNSEHKVSRADSKKHDKRWEEVPPWANGTPEAVLGLLCRHQSFNDIERYALALQVFAEFSADGNYPGSVSKWVGLPQRHLDWAFSGVDNAVRAYRHRKELLRCVESYKQNIEGDRLRREAQSEASSST